jgi:hypothetical protein
LVDIRLTCWFCTKEFEIGERGEDDKDGCVVYLCKNCNTENRKEIQMAVPKMYDIEFIKKTMLTKGDKVDIIEEFAPNPKFKSFLVGKIEYNGENYLLDVNKTSYKLISQTYGEDTSDWVGKKLVFMGEQQLGNMKGFLWDAEK